MNVKNLHVETIMILAGEYVLDVLTFKLAGQNVLFHL
jgi:hypothetical protein